MERPAHYVPPKGSPDCQLVTMQAEIMRLSKEMYPLDAAHLRLMHKAMDHHPPCPVEEVSSLSARLSLKELRLAYGNDPEALEKLPTIWKALRPWQRECDEIDRRMGVTAAAATLDANRDAQNAAIDRLIRARPKTLGGAVYKLRLAFAIEPNLDCEHYPLMHEDMVERVLDDLARIVEREARP